MKRVKMENRVVDYYNNNYDEEKRLSDGCDNRHLVEREVKKSIIEKYLPKRLSSDLHHHNYMKEKRDKLWI